MGEHAGGGYRSARADMETLFRIDQPFGRGIGECGPGRMDALIGRGIGIGMGVPMHQHQPVMPARQGPQLRQ